jgi:RNA recognition motif-containing protein
VAFTLRFIGAICDQPSIILALTSLCEVTACDLVMDKQTGGSKGFGFVEMPNPKHAKYAIKNLNDKTIANSRIRVKVAEEK